MDADLIGAQLAEILGALLATPIAGSPIAIVREVLLYCRGAAPELS